MPGKQNKQNDKSARDILRVLFRRRWLFLLSAALFMVAAFAMSLKIPKQYTASTRFVLQSDLAVEGLPTAKAASFAALEQRVDQMIESPAAVEAAIEKVESNPDFKSESNGFTVLEGLPRIEGELTAEGQARKQAIVRAIAQDVKFVKERRSRGVEQLVARVQFTSENPAFAYRLPNALVRNYQEKIHDYYLKKLNDSMKTVREQFVSLEEELKTKREEKVRFDKEHAGKFINNMALLNQNKTRLESVIDEMGRDIDKAKIRKDKLQTKKNDLNKMLNDVMGEGAGGDASPEGRPLLQEVVGPNPEYREIVREIEKARQGLDTLQTLQGKKESHPDVILQKKNIEMLEKKLAETPEEIVLEKIYGHAGMGGSGGAKDLLIELSSTTADLETVTAEIAAMQNELERLKKQAEKYTEMESDYALLTTKEQQLRETLHNIEREYQDKRRQYATLKQHYDLQVKNQRTNFEIEMAERPYRPSYPTLSMILLLAVGGGVAFGTAMVLGVNMMERTVTTTEEAVNMFDFPIHGVIAEIVTPRQRAVRKLKRWAVAPVVTFVVGLSIAWFAWGAYLRLEDTRGFEYWLTDQATLISRNIVQPARSVLGGPPVSPTPVPAPKATEPDAPKPDKAASAGMPGHRMANR